jgi:hypothetical protein
VKLATMICGTAAFVLLAILSAAEDILTHAIGQAIIGAVLIAAAYLLGRYGRRTASAQPVAAEPSRMVADLENTIGHPIARWP